MQTIRFWMGLMGGLAGMVASQAVHAEGPSPAVWVAQTRQVQAQEASDHPAQPAYQAGHPIELSFRGPATSETSDPNPFTDYRVDVTFQNGDFQHTIRGFYAADGQTAETGADAGNMWKVRFTTEQIGTWVFKATFRQGRDIAIAGDPHAGQILQEFSSAGGSFQVVQSAPRDSDSHSSDSFYDRGQVTVDGTHYRFASGDYWLKGGCDSPENLLAFADFDDTYRMKAEARDGEAAAPEKVHMYTPHVDDWREGDPSWRGGKGKALVGGVNYLSSQGVNSMYFLTMNIGGDGKDVWPYASPDDFTRFDCSKLDQWDLLFKHMQSRGIALHVVLQETENERLLDDGETGRLRQLYLCELIARFAHHPALIWNLGEENGPADFSPLGQTNEQQRAMASYLKSEDDYQHPVVIHTHASEHGKEEILPGLLGHKPLDGLSFQVDEPERVHRELIEWQRRSAESGHAWMIGMDEIGKWHTGVVPDSVDPDHDGLRKYVLWGALLAGASGVEWYFGAHQPHNDLTCEDWRQRENIWRQTTIARRFFETHLPYWEMTTADTETDCADDYCFAKLGEVYAAYLPSGQTTRLNLSGTQATFTVAWFDPKHGGQLQSGSLDQVSGGGWVSVGEPPSGDARDWVLLVKAADRG